MNKHVLLCYARLFKGFALPPTPFLGSGASFQGPGPLPMASARRAMLISLIESFWRAIGADIRPFLFS